MVSIDAELISIENQATAANVNGKVLDFGENGVTASAMYCMVKLTKGCTTGAVASVKVQSAPTAEFSTPVDEMTITVPAGVVQTAPCDLVQFRMPLQMQNRYCRIVVVGGSIAPAGGKLWAYLTPEFNISL